MFGERGNCVNVIFSGLFTFTFPSYPAHQLFLMAFLSFLRCAETVHYCGPPVTRVRNSVLLYTIMFLHLRAARKCSKLAKRES